MRKKNRCTEINVRRGDPNRSGEACGWFATFKGDRRKPRPVGKGMNWRAAVHDLIHEQAAEPPGECSSRLES